MRGRLRALRRDAPWLARAARKRLRGPTREERLFPEGRNGRAWHAFAEGLRAHPHLSDRESRLCELVEFFGWDVGSRGIAATPWLFDDDPRKARYQEQLGVEGQVFGVLHMYALFNRLDRERHDLFWIFDGLVERLAALGGPGRVSVLDFGCGLGQAGLAFCLQGYRTVMSDRVDLYLDFVRFLAATRELSPVLHKAPGDHDYYDTRADGHRYGVVLDWGTFEHVRDTIEALECVTGGLVPGGMFVTTTFCKDWTPELVAFYRRDSGEEGLAEQYMSPEVDAWLRERFDVLSPARTIAKVLVRRGAPELG